MLGYVIAALFGTLGGILVYDVAKVVIETYRRHQTRKECDLWEDRQFEKECKVAFANLGKIYRRIEKEHLNESQQSKQV